MNYKQFTKQQDINFSNIFLFNQGGENEATGESTEETPVEEKEVAPENKETHESSPPTTKESVSQNNEVDSQTTKPSNPSRGWGLGSLSSILKNAWETRGNAPKRETGPRPDPHYITMESVANWMGNIPAKGSPQDVNPKNHPQKSNSDTQPNPQPNTSQKVQTSEPVTSRESQTQVTDNSNVAPKNNKSTATSNPAPATTTVKRRFSPAPGDSSKKFDLFGWMSRGSKQKDTEEKGQQQVIPTGNGIKIPSMEEIANWMTNTPGRFSPRNQNSRAIASYAHPEDPYYGYNGEENGVPLAHQLPENYESLTYANNPLPPEGMDFHPGSTNSNTSQPKRKYIPGFFSYPKEKKIETKVPLAHQLPREMPPEQRFNTAEGQSLQATAQPKPRRRFAPADGDKSKVFDFRGWLGKITGQQDLEEVARSMTKTPGAYYAHPNIPSHGYNGQPNEVPDAHRVPVGYNSGVRSGVYPIGDFYDLPLEMQGYTKPIDYASLPVKKESSGVDTTLKDPYYAHPQTTSTGQAPTEIPSWFYPTKEQVAQASTYGSTKGKPTSSASTNTTDSITQKPQGTPSKTDPFSLLRNEENEGFFTSRKNEPFADYVQRISSYLPSHDELSSMGIDSNEFYRSLYELGPRYNVPPLPEGEPGNVRVESNPAEGSGNQTVVASGAVTPGSTTSTGSTGTSTPATRKIVDVSDRNSKYMKEGVDAISKVFASENRDVFGRPKETYEQYLERMGDTINETAKTYHVDPDYLGKYWFNYPVTTANPTPQFSFKPFDFNSFKFDDSKLSDEDKIFREYVEANSDDLRGLYSSDPKELEKARNLHSQHIFKTDYNNLTPKQKEQADAWEKKIKKEYDFRKVEDDEGFIHDPNLDREFTTQRGNAIMSHYASILENAKKNGATPEQIKEIETARDKDLYQNNRSVIISQALDFAENNAKNITRDMWPQKEETMSQWWDRLDSNQKTGLLVGGGVGLLGFLMMAGKEEKDVVDWLLALGIPIAGIGGGAYFGSSSKAKPGTFNARNLAKFMQSHGHGDYQGQKKA